MLHRIETIFVESLTITSFVTIMLLVIEYFNIKTKGTWFQSLKQSRIKQVIFGSFMGFLPGCLGGYAVVSLYTHGVVGFGSLLAAFIATAGDETFIMLSLFPLTAIYIMIGLFFAGIIFGFLSEKFLKIKIKTQNKHFEVHQDEHCSTETDFKTNINDNLRNPSFVRAILLFGLLLFIIFLLTGLKGHSHESGSTGHGTDDIHQFSFFVIEEWMQYSFIALALVAMYIISVVSEHFLSEHLWKHVIKKHFLKIFLWILFSVALIETFLYFVEPENIMNQDIYYWTFCLFAIGIGFIPQSGPHIIFISLFSQNMIPLSTLLINTLVQEGHAGLPLIAESKKSFILTKLIKIAIALLLAISGYYFKF